MILGKSFVLFLIKYSIENGDVVFHYYREIERELEQNGR